MVAHHRLGCRAPGLQSATRFPAPAQTSMERRGAGGGAWRGGYGAGGRRVGAGQRRLPGRRCRAGPISFFAIRRVRPRRPPPRRGAVRRAHTASAPSPRTSGRSASRSTARRRAPSATPAASPSTPPGRSRIGLNVRYYQVTIERLRECKRGGPFGGMAGPRPAGRHGRLPRDEPEPARTRRPRGAAPDVRAGPRLPRGPSAPGAARCVQGHRLSRLHPEVAWRCCRSRPSPCAPVSPPNRPASPLARASAWVASRRTSRRSGTRRLAGRLASLSG